MSLERSARAHFYANRSKTFIAHAQYVDFSSPKSVRQIKYRLRGRDAIFRVIGYTGRERPRNERGRICDVSDTAYVFSSTVSKIHVVYTIAVRVYSPKQQARSVLRTVLGRQAKARR